MRRREEHSVADSRCFTANGTESDPGKDVRIVALARAPCPAALDLHGRSAGCVARGHIAGVVIGAAAVDQRPGPNGIGRESKNEMTKAACRAGRSENGPSVRTLSAVIGRIG